MMIPAPLEGEWLWLEELQTWIPLLTTNTGYPDVEKSISKADNI